MSLNVEHRSVRALPSDKPIRLLDNAGHAVHGSSTGGFDLPDVDTLLELYRRMVVARRFDVQVTALTKQGRLATYPSAYGQEACEIGAISAIEARDWFFPTYRDSIALLTRGIEPGRHPAVVPRRLAQRVRPARAPHGLAGDAARDAGAARRRPRARRPAAPGSDRHHDVPRRRRHERGRRARGVQLRGGVADADRLPRAEQPVRDQRAALPPDAGRPRSPTRRSATACPASTSTATTSRRSTRSRAPPSSGRARVADPP